MPRVQPEEMRSFLAEAPRRGLPNFLHVYGCAPLRTATSIELFPDVPSRVLRATDESGSIPLLKPVTHRKIVASRLKRGDPFEKRNTVKEGVNENRNVKMSAT